MTESGKEMVAESVKIGDRLTLTIAIDDQGKKIIITRVGFTGCRREISFSCGYRFVWSSVWSVMHEATGCLSKDKE